MINSRLDNLQVNDEERIEKNEIVKDDSVRIDVVIRSRLCEVIGKVLRELG